MSLHAEDPIEAVVPDAVARLQRRLERERQARRQAEEIADRGMRELWLTNRQLDERVAERTADLEKTLNELEVASSSRERFLSTLSHETRTPLNGILGMLELIAPHVDGEQAADYVTTARQSAERLSQLLTRLLDLVELDSGQLRSDPEVVRIGDLAESIRNRWQLPAMRSGHLLSVSSASLADIEVSLDSQRFQQIANELLDNAVTHGDRGTIQVEIKTDASELLLSIIDAGPGINPQEIDRLLGDFTMVDASAARAQEGLGLGLSLCRRIAETLGWVLRLENDGDGHTVASLQVALSQ